MSITQGQRLVRDYASQFETLLGRLDSYDESMMLNQFIWGLQPQLARSVSLHYPKSIAQTVSLAETTELVVKASRRPTTKTCSSGTRQKAQVHPIGTEDSWRGGTGRRRGQVGGRMGMMVEEVEDQVGDEEEHLDIPDLTRWHVIGVGRGGQIIRVRNTTCPLCEIGVHNAPRPHGCRPQRNASTNKFSESAVFRVSFCVFRMFFRVFRVFLQFHLNLTYKMFLTLWMQQAG